MRWPSRLMIMEGWDGFGDGLWIWLAPDCCGDKEQQLDSYVEVLNENPAWKVIGKCLSDCTLLNLLYSFFKLISLHFRAHCCFYKHTCSTFFSFPLIIFCLFIDTKQMIIKNKRKKSLKARWVNYLWSGACVESSKYGSRIRQTYLIL